MSIRYIPKCNISDGEGGTVEVCAGEQVELLPTHPEKPCGEERKYLSHENARFMRRFLEVDGPYTISWIGMWPCGGINLYLKIPGREPGTHARDFRPATQK